MVRHIFISRLFTLIFNQLWLAPEAFLFNDLRKRNVRKKEAEEVEREGEREREEERKRYTKKVKK